MNNEQQSFIKEFYEEFSKKVGDTVVSLEMAKFEAPPSVLKSLNLEKKFASSELWGLFVFCSKNLYFYVHPYESALGTMLRQSYRGKPPKEQMVNISALDYVYFYKSEKKWYDFLFGGRKLFMDFQVNGNEVQTVSITTQHTCDVVFEKLKSIFEKK